MKFTDVSKLNIQLQDHKDIDNDNKLIMNFLIYMYMYVLLYVCMGNRIWKGRLDVVHKRDRERANHAVTYA